MARLLYIEASPRKERSASIMAARGFLSAYADAHPGDEIETIDLWEVELPEFDGATIDAKYRVLHGQPHSEAEADAWNGVVAAAGRFASADKYLFSLPMWNFGIPYKLKHFIDVITQPGLTFSFSPDAGYQGLVTGRPAAVIYARGGEYSSGPQAQALDHQKPYLEMWLRFIGFTDIHAITIEPTLAPPQVADRAKDAGQQAAAELARGF